MATYNAAPPPDWAGYRSQVENAYQRAAAQLGTQTSNLLTQTGFKAGALNPASGIYAAPIGKNRGYEVDTGNQFGGIQQLLQNYGHGLTQTRAASNAAGIHGGLAGARQALIRHQLGSASQNLYNNFQNAFTGLQGQISGAFGQRNDQLNLLGRQESAYNSAYTNDPTAPGGPQYMPDWLKQLLQTASTPAATPPQDLTAGLPPGTTAQLGPGGTQLYITEPGKPTRKIAY